MIKFLLIQALQVTNVTFTSVLTNKINKKSSLVRISIFHCMFK